MQIVWNEDKIEPFPLYWQIGLGYHSLQSPNAALVVAPIRFVGDEQYAVLEMPVELADYFFATCDLESVSAKYSLQASDQRPLANLSLEPPGSELPKRSSGSHSPQTRHCRQRSPLRCAFGSIPNRPSSAQHASPDRATFHCPGRRAKNKREDQCPPFCLTVYPRIRRARFLSLQHMARSRPSASHLRRDRIRRADRCQSQPLAKLNSGEGLWPARHKR